MPQNPQNKISQNAIKHYNKFRNIRTEPLRWVQMTTDTGMKFKVETSSKCSKKLHLQSYLEMLWPETGYFGLLGNNQILFIILLYLIER